MSRLSAGFMMGARFRLSRRGRSKSLDGLSGKPFANSFFIAS